jgi:hypothetical protein
MRAGRETQQLTSWAVRGQSGERGARMSHDDPRVEAPASHTWEADVAGEPPRWDAAAGELW